MLNVVIKQGACPPVFSSRLLLFDTLVASALIIHGQKAMFLKTVQKSAIKQATVRRVSDH